MLVDKNLISALCDIFVIFGKVLGNEELSSGKSPFYVKVIVTECHV